MYLLILILQLPLTAKAQSEKGMLERKIIFSRSSMHLDSVLEDISRQTSVLFAFNSSQLKSRKIISLKKGNQTLEEWLTYMQNNLGIHYTILGSHIVLVDKRYKEQIAEKASQTSRNYVKTGNKIFNKNISVKSPNSTGSNSNVSKKMGVKFNQRSDVSLYDSSSVQRTHKTEISEEAGLAIKTNNDSAVKTLIIIAPVNNMANDTTEIIAKTKEKRYEPNITTFEATPPVENVGKSKSYSRVDSRGSDVSGNQLQLSVEAGLVNLQHDRTTLQFGTGAFIKGLHGIGRTSQLSLSGGILTFGRGGQAMLRNGTLRLIPVLLGIRKHLNTFYIEPQAGYGNYKGRMIVNNAYSIISVGAIYWGLNAGFNFKHIDIGMRYQGALRNGDDFGGNFPAKIFNFTGLHVGYNFLW